MARAGAYRLTPARRRALRNAQLISARKRKRNKKIAKGVLAGAGVALIGAAAYGRHKRSGSSLYMKPIVSDTPTQEIAGRRVKATRAGLRVSRHNSGFSATLTARIPIVKKDILLLSYRHKPLTRYALLGRKVKNTVTEFKPQNAYPGYDPETRRVTPVPDIYRWANEVPLSEANKNRRNVYKYQNSIARGVYIRKGIGGVEAIRRLRKYENSLKKRGVEYNRPHAEEVFKQLLEEGI